MAQDFERTLTKDIDASLTDISPAIVMMSRVKASHTSTPTITADVAITNSGNTVQAYIIKNAPIPSGSSLELIDGGAKIVLQS